MEEQVGEETVEFDQDAGGDSEPKGREHRSGGQEFFHGGMPKQGRKRMLPATKRAAGFGSGDGPDSSNRVRTSKEISGAKW
jgi:hypothetical protein